MEIMCPFWQNNYLVTSKFLWQRSMQGQYLPHLARGRKHPVLRNLGHLVSQNSDKDNNLYNSASSRPGPF